MIDRVARETFGFEELRPGQRETIESVVGGRDTLVVMSTGSGREVGYRTLGVELVLERGLLEYDRPAA